MTAPPGNDADEVKGAAQGERSEDEIARKCGRQRMRAVILSTDESDHADPGEEQSKAG